MKLAIIPKYVLLAILSIGVFFSFSYVYNPGHGFFGYWFAYLGVIGAILCITKMHAVGDSQRTINGFHYKRAIYRTCIALLLSYLCYIPFLDQFKDNWNLVLSVVNLAGNMGFLFGIFFDPWINKEKGNHWLYHGGESWYDIQARKNPILFLIGEIIGFLATAYIELFVIAA